MSEIDSLINEVKLGDEQNIDNDESSDKSTFQELFQEAERNVLKVTQSIPDDVESCKSQLTEIVNTETESVVSTLSNSTSRTRKSLPQSEASTKISALTQENLRIKQREEEDKLLRQRRSLSIRSAKTNRTNKTDKSNTSDLTKSVKSEKPDDIKSITSLKSHTNYTSLENYRKSITHQVKKRHKLDLTGSPMDVIDRVDDMVKDICSQYEDPLIRKEMSEKHRNMILVQIFLNVMNTNRRDIAKACRESMSKQTQKKVPNLP